MRIFWVGLATRYLACAVSVSRNSGLMSLLSKSKYTVRWASGLLGSSRGLTAGAAGGGVAGAAGATVAGAAVGAVVVGFTFLEQATVNTVSTARIKARRNVFMGALLWMYID